MQIDEGALPGLGPHEMPPYPGVQGVELGHHGDECSFDAFVRKYELLRDPAMAYMAKVIRGADTDDKTITPESSGVEALLDGLRITYYPDDQAQRLASYPVLDALYAYCRERTSSGGRTPRKVT